MEAFSALLAFCAGNSPVTSEFPAQRPVTRSFDVFVDLDLNQQLSTHWRRWWFETPSRPLWRHCYEITGPVVLNHSSDGKRFYVITSSSIKWLLHNALATVAWQTMGQVTQSTSSYYVNPRYTLQWRHDERYGVSNHRCLDCVCSGADQRKHQSYASPAVVRGFQR